MPHGGSCGCLACVQTGGPPNKWVLKQQMQQADSQQTPNSKHLAHPYICPRPMLTQTQRCGWAPRTSLLRNLQRSSKSMTKPRF